MIYVIDNFLPYRDWDLLYNAVTSQQIKWASSTVVAHDSLYQDYDPRYNFQLIHMFLESRSDIMINKNTFYLLDALLKKINPREWIRIKLNLNPCNSNIIKHGLHVDHYSQRTDAWTAIYYINTNNGYTLFEDGSKIDSIENRLVVFPSTLKHTGTTCTDTYARFVLNLNFYKDNIKELVDSGT